MKRKSKTGKKHRRNGRMGLVPFSPNGRRKPKLRHVSVSDEIIHRPLSKIRPSPNNDRLYRPPDLNNHDFREFVDQVRVNGVTDPLVVTIDCYICSGHRRYAAAKAIGLDTVPCRTADMYHDDPRFLAFLRDCNRQRPKTLDEVMREEVVSANPEEAHRALQEYREQQALVHVDTIALDGAKNRHPISKAKREFLDAIKGIITEHRNEWPLSVRRIHYYLLNDPPLKHASKPGSTYRNDRESYQSADELITRARLTSEIPFEAIHDPTRLVVTWNVFQEPSTFIRGQLNKFMKGYYRDLMQSQPNHVEIIGEKNTIEGVISPVAMEYTIPYTIGRGYSSLPPRHDMAVRFRRSGKEKLILLILSDFDPEGEDIGRSFAQSMRDDFGIINIVPIKVALTKQQVDDLGLPPNLLTREKNSSRKGKFVKRFGEASYELEAVPTATLRQNLRDAIDSVIDLDAFNGEIDREKEDAAYLDTVRRKAHTILGDLGIERA